MTYIVKRPIHDDDDNDIIAAYKENGNVVIEMVDESGEEVVFVELSIDEAKEFIGILSTLVGELEIELENEEIKEIDSVFEKLIVEGNLT